MQVLTKDEFELHKEELLMKIKEGAVFIHPTDTIYGIGCNAKSEKAVRKVRDIKERYERPFSVIAPSKDWIKKNCHDGESWLSKLPGPYTLILKLKDKNCIVSEVNNGMDTLGVRIPDHWFTVVASEAKVPLITTSANITGNDFMTTLDNLDPKIAAKIDFIVYEGEKHGRPSKIVDLTSGEKITER
ncbi:MAG: threonylcarbamoyl-AMP synthase [Nanoarchaeota archaeon]|nr:threonylcarbamoyl-AMP synthase [Nanoarchaeota archaeon]